jgi:predicted DCC family thiol-disulfide oxidoreductase YuxK
MQSSEISGPVVLFDGICRFCDTSVRFVIKHDPKRIFRFAPLHGVADAAKDGSTMILLENGQAHFRSEAALRIAAKLRAPWSALRIFLAVPRPIRDAVYRFIAANRYRWFGQKPACELPNTPDRERFLS